MTDDNTPPPTKRVIASADYDPASQTTVLTDNHNRETVIRNVTQEEYNKICAEFLSNKLTSTATKTNTGKTNDLSVSLAASELSSLMGAGVPESSENKSK